MTHKEFQIQMARLSETFKTAYSTERVAIILKLVGNEDADWWRRTVDHLIGSQRQAPLLAEINELLLQERERRWQKQKHAKIERSWDAHADCSYCHDFGYYVCRHREQGGIWAFKCHCRRGVESGLPYPHFTDSHKDAGFYYHDGLSKKKGGAQ